MMADYFRTLARYNAWANKRLYEACAGLPDAEYRKPRQAFFGSLHGTLNHIMVGDRVWLGRIEGKPSGVRSLDQILYDDLASLRAAREAEDERIKSTVAPLSDADLGKILRYRTLAHPQTEMATPLHLVFGHMFNHETHHRGQAHCLLSQAGVSPPPLDLIFYLRDGG
jgi:uncharacterized damage-inducible protein DinB